jgi:chemotaxis protein MotA
MQKSTLVGLGAGLVVIYGTIFLGSGWSTFFDVGALLIVFLGTVCGMLVNYTFADFKDLVPALQAFLSFSPPPLAEKVGTFDELSTTARRDGLLALDRALDDIDDGLLSFGLELAVDGTPEEEIVALTNRWIDRDIYNYDLVGRVFNTAGTLAPAFGMIGTLIGLIQMLQNLEDPSQIGAGMSVAMVTTFYGALLSNLVCLPIAGKAHEQKKAILKSHELTQTGILAVVRGDRPSQIQRRLQTFIRSEETVASAGDDEDGEEPLSRAA